MDNDFLINDLFNALEDKKISKLHFTHFMFLLGPLPQQEIRIILESIRDREFNHLREIVIDVDAMFKNPFQEIFDSIF